MKNRKKIEAYIRERVLHWMVELDLVTWEFNLKFKKVEESPSGDPAWATVSTSWEYKTIDVKVNSPMMAEGGVTKAFIDKTLAHELYHAKVARGWDIVRLLSDTLATVIVKLEEREVAELELMPLTRRAFKGESVQ